MLDRPDKEKDTTLTPLWLIEALGNFDLDPCAYPNHKTANNLNVWPSDGLSIDWHGRVWCNPPYSKPKPWLERMANHNNGVALVLASTDTEWFHEASKSCSSILFMKGRPFFIRESDRVNVKLMRATLLIEWGNSNSLEKSGIEGYLVKSKL